MGRKSSKKPSGSRRGHPEPQGTGTDTDPIPAGSDRDSRGRFTPGNRLSVKHGLHASRLKAELTRARQEFYSQSTADDGGESEIGIRRRSQHQYRARIHVLLLAMAEALETHGLHDRRGKLRVSWLMQVQSLVDRAIRIDQALGLDRRARTVDLARALSGLPSEDRP